MQLSEPLLTPGEVAAMFGVNPKTVARWAANGALPSIRTPGGHRRYRQSDVLRLLGSESAGEEPRQHSGTHERSRPQR